MGYQILSFGEILFDVFPDKHRLGGAPFNFASHLHGFGQDIIFLSRIGIDDYGREIEDLLEKQNFPQKHIQLDHSRPTGHVQVTLDKSGSAEYEIVREVAWDYIILNKKLKNRLKKNPDLVYFGTLAQRSPQSRDTLQQIMTAIPEDCKVMCDLNLRQNFYSIEILHDCFVHSDILKLNEDELNVVKDLFVPLKDEKEFARWLLTKFNVTKLCITRGKDGATLYADGHPHDMKTAKALSPEQIADTVGAGDAFASILALGVLSGWSPRVILERASAFAAEICTISGALPTDPSFYTTFAIEHNLQSL